MIDFSRIKSIYIAQGFTDLRKGIDGYACIVQDIFKLSPFEDSLFIFCNRDRNKLKCLYWDGTGFWLLYNRLEKGHFKWINSPDETSKSISHQQLSWLLSGLKIEQKSAFEKQERKYV